MIAIFYFIFIYMCLLIVERGGVTVNFF